MGAGQFNAETWRAGLAKSAVDALQNDQTVPYKPEGPLRAVIQMRDANSVAPKIANRWNLRIAGNQIIFNAPDIKALYMELIRICYLTPLVEKTLPFCLAAYNLWGRVGLAWVRRHIRTLNF